MLVIPEQIFSIEGSDADLAGISCFTAIIWTDLWLLSLTISNFWTPKTRLYSRLGWNHITPLEHSGGRSEVSSPCAVARGDRYRPAGGGGGGDAWRGPLKTGYNGGGTGEPGTRGDGYRSTGSSGTDDALARHALNGDAGDARVSGVFFNRGTGDGRSRPLGGLPNGRGDGSKCSV